MFELKFAAEVSDLTGTWAVGVLALVYGQYYSGITLPALAEESGPGISSQLFPRWMTKPLSSPCLKTSGIAWAVYSRDIHTGVES